MKCLKTEKFCVHEATIAETHSYVRPYWDVLQQEHGKSQVLTKCKAAGKNKLHTNNLMPFTFYNAAKN